MCKVWPIKSGKMFNKHFVFEVKHFENGAKVDSQLIKLDSNSYSTIIINVSCEQGEYVCGKENKDYN